MLTYLDSRIDCWISFWAIRPVALGAKVALVGRGRCSFLQDCCAVPHPPTISGAYPDHPSGVGARNPKLHTPARLLVNVALSTKLSNLSRNFSKLDLMIIYFAQRHVIPTGQEDFFFAYALKNKALHWAASKWFSAFAWANQWQYCYVSINHFAAATATE